MRSTPLLCRKTMCMLTYGLSPSGVCGGALCRTSVAYSFNPTTPAPSIMSGLCSVPPTPGELLLLVLLLMLLRVPVLPLVSCCQCRPACCCLRRCCLSVLPPLPLVPLLSDAAAAAACLRSCPHIDKVMMYTHCSWLQFRPCIPTSGVALLCACCVKVARTHGRCHLGLGER
jgi:hypothetical protein